MRIDRMSASKAKTFSMCPFKFFLQYTIYAPQKPSFAAQLGTVIHEILERYAAALINGKDEEGRDREWLDKNWKKVLLREGYRELDSWQTDRHIGKVTKDCDNCKAFTDGTCGIVDKPVESFQGCPYPSWIEACNMVTRVLKDDSLLSLFNDPSKILSTEEKFRFNIKKDGREYLVNGIIDLVIKIDDDTLEIIDYKTGRHQISYSEAEKDIQLMLYYLAARELYPQFKHHMVTIFYLQGGKKRITSGFDDQTVEEIKDRIANIWQCIEAEKRPTRICDRPNGQIKPNHICQYMCDWELCKKVYPKVQEYLDQGGDIESLYSLEDLGFPTEEVKDE